MKCGRQIGLRSGLKRPVVSGLVAVTVTVLVGLAGCGDVGSGGETTTEGAGSAVLADSSFLADIAQNVAGEWLSVTSLVPEGSDPHAFQPTPQDAKRIVDCRVFVMNTPGLEPTVDRLVAGVGKSGPLVIEAAQGLEGVAEDPHCWMDPVAVLTYVDNIRAGFSAIMPEREAAFAENAEAYQQELRELDLWISAQVESIPEERRLLVTNHESLGRFAKRYGFQVVGSIFPTVSGDGTPSAQQLAALVKGIRETGTPAIFLEAGSNPAVAQQVADETGVQVVTDLYIHSTGPGAPTYLEMMRWDVTRIVEALR